MPHAFVGLAPPRRREVPPVQPAESEVLATISHHPKEGIVGLKNAAIEVPDENTDDVAFDQAPDPGFAFREIAIQTRVLERDCGLRGKKLQHRDARGTENARRQLVFKVKDTYEFALVE